MDSSDGRYTWVPPRPAPGAVIGYIGGVGPFYTRCRDPEDDDLTWSSFGHSFQLSSTRPRLELLDVTNSLLPPSDRRRVQLDEKRISFRDFVSSGFTWRGWGINGSVWVTVVIGALFVSNVIFLLSFVSNSWGVLHVLARQQNGDVIVSDVTAGVTGDELERDDIMKWHFGLWQCCRSDGVCLGARWPVLYSATRACAVLSLFGHALTLAWTLGHTAEQLLVYDPCTVTSLACICFFSGLCSLGAVSCFGALWPSQFSDVFEILSARLGYSFYLAALSVPLTLVAGVGTLAAFRTSLRRFHK